MYYRYFNMVDLLFVVGFLFSLWASLSVKSRINQFHKVANRVRMTGADVARKILDSEGLYNVPVECLKKDDGDHYHPTSRAVRLSRRTYYSSTVTAMAVAAHECGHAIQHAEGYTPMSVRSSLVPVVNVASYLAMPILLLGLFLGRNLLLIRIGILAFSAALLFQLVTLPVELNASERALKKLNSMNLVGNDELTGCKKVLWAAAMTYVAAVVSAAISVIRVVFFFKFGRYRR